ncbi:hypothetical protein RF11_02911 [Thelohanellus kitauei]|uniref:Uncharacterized protein n=1 Tax=Thelohanellus kitauei TaxID=669202 RepID=A0A0C2NBN4_THEKT|nr:hypothetical protein RF11_02911 [Thelohanellus kitauei]
MVVSKLVVKIFVLFVLRFSQATSNQTAKDHTSPVAFERFRDCLMKAGVDICKNRIDKLKALFCAMSMKPRPGVVRMLMNLQHDLHKQLTSEVQHCLGRPIRALKSLPCKSMEIVKNVVNEGNMVDSRLLHAYCFVENDINGEHDKPQKPGTTESVPGKTNASGHNTKDSIKNKGAQRHAGNPSGRTSSTQETDVHRSKDAKPGPKPVDSRNGNQSSGSN